MADNLALLQILPDGTPIPMITSARGEVDAAEIVDLYPGADYHFLYAGMKLEQLTPAQELDVFS